MSSEAGGECVDSGNETQVTLASIIKGFRERSGLSQAALAHKLGVTQQTVGRWENGATPQPRYAKRLTHALQIPEGLQDELGIDLVDNKHVDPLEARTQILGAYAVRIENGPPLGVEDTRILSALLDLAIDFDRTMPEPTVVE